MLTKTQNDIQKWLPQLQSHRGSWTSGIKENTLAAIQKSYELGFRMTEFDIRMTSDNIIILHHDSRLNGISVRKMSYRQVLQSSHVTTLEEVLKWFCETDHSYKLNIEIKSSIFLNPKFEFKLCRLIQKFKVEDRVLISSFNFVSLLKMRLFSPKIKRAWLVSLEKHSEKQFKYFFHFVKLVSAPNCLHLRYQDLSESIKRISMKLPIVLWTVNDLEILKKNKNIIIGIISDTILPQDLKGI